MIPLRGLFVAPFDSLADPRVVGDARDVRFRPAPDGYFVIGLDRPEDLDEVTAGLGEHDPAPGFEVVVDLRPEQNPDEWLDRGASWVLPPLSASMRLGGGERSIHR